MKIREIVTENIFTCDYRLVMDAVASLYKEHYDVDIWSNADAHDAAAQVLMKEHPSAEELESIITTQQLPERFQQLNFPLNDDILGISTQDTGFTEAAPPVANAPAASRVAAAPYGYNTDTGEPNPPPAKAASTTPAAAKEPIVQATDDMEQRMLDRMGKRFGLPPGSSADEVQAAQQDYLGKNDPAAAAQYKKNMANIDAGGSHADNAPLKLAPTAGPGKVQASPDDAGGMAAAKAGKSPIAIMLAQPTIGKNQAMLDIIAPTVGLPVGSSAAEILAADDARNAKAKNKYAPATPAAAPATESMGGATDSKGRTQREWLRLVRAKFPDAKIQQAKMIDGPIRAILANGKTLNWSKAETMVDEEPASRSLCTSGKPDSALGASQLASCKSQGYRSRDGGKTHKVGSDRIGVRGKKIKGKKYGGPLPDWS